MMQQPKFKTKTVISGWQTDRRAVMTQLPNCPYAFLVKIVLTTSILLNSKYVDMKDDKSIDEMVDFLISNIDDVSNGGFEERREKYREMLLTITYDKDYQEHVTSETCILKNLARRACDEQQI